MLKIIESKTMNDGLAKIESLAVGYRYRENAKRGQCHKYSG